MDWITLQRSECDVAQDEMPLGAAQDLSEIHWLDTISQTMCRLQRVEYGKMAEKIKEACVKAFSEAGKVFCSTKIKGEELTAMKERVLTVGLNASSCLLVAAVALLVLSSTIKAIVIGGAGIYLRQNVMNAIGNKYPDLLKNATYSISGHTAWI